MLTIVVPDRYACSDPPCQVFVLIPQGDADLNLLAELIDMPCCNRAPDAQRQAAGQTGRILGGPLADLCELVSVGEKGDDYAEALLANLANQSGKTREDLLRTAFHFRIFQW